MNGSVIAARILDIVGTHVGSQAEISETLGLKRSNWTRIKRNQKQVSVPLARKVVRAWPQIGAIPLSELIREDTVPVWVREKRKV